MSTHSKTFFWFSLCCLSINESLCQPKPVFISLGAWCVPALFLRHYELREAAYPFDWLTTGTTPESLHNILRNDFEDFCQKEDLAIDHDAPTFVQNKRTGCAFAHDFPVQDKKYYHIASNYLDFYPAVKAKYDRRIQRFKETLSSSRKIIFIRIDLHGAGTQDQAIALRNLIQSKYPNLDFVLIQLGFDEEHKQPWNIDLIRNYYIDPESVANKPIWNYPCWSKIITEIEKFTGYHYSELKRAQPPHDN